MDFPQTKTHDAIWKTDKSNYRIFMQKIMLPNLRMS